MLFKNKFLELIKQQRVRSAFRKWVRPTVKEGGTILTSVGRLKVISLKTIDYTQITEKEIREAGYDSRMEMDKEMQDRQDGQIYKIQFVLEADPRIKLRANDQITDTEFKEILKKLNRLDSSGSIKNWTMKVLKAIDAYPGKRAVELATELGYEKDWFKLNVRKLKNLGLTISMETGYTISPRGKACLRRLMKT